MLKFWSVINCIFVHWTKKLTLRAYCPNVYTVFGLLVNQNLFQRIHMRHFLCVAYYNWVSPKLQLGLILFDFALILFTFSQKNPLCALLLGTARLLFSTRNPALCNLCGYRISRTNLVLCGLFCTLHILFF